MRHDIMHDKRNPAPAPVPQVMSTIGTDRLIPTGTPSVSTPGGLLTASASAFTTITEVVVSTISQPGTIVTTTTTRTIQVTDAAVYSSLKASEASKSISATGSAPATTSSTTHKSEGEKSNLGTLIPAIVGPIAGVLIISFVLFWYFMRRRARREADDQPEFAMKEKPLSRESSTKSGTSSTRELVPTSKVEKPPTITPTDVERPSMDLFPAAVPRSEIGVARPMTPPTRNAGPHSRDTSIKGSRSNVPNFSGLQPNGVRSRSGSTTAQGAASVGLSFTNSNSRNNPYDTRGPGPGPRPATAPRPPPAAAMGPRGSPDRQNGLPSRPHPPGSAGRDFPPRGPPPMNTNMKSTNRAGPPAPLNPPTPTGAFNGASPISQYSPIVKDHPVTYDNPPPPPPAQQSRSATDPRSNNSPQRNRAMPPTIDTRQRADGNGGADSPTYDNVLSGEHLRIARLANSSRLGFNSPIDSPRVGSPAPREPIGASARSPELPPPVSRMDGALKPYPAASAGRSTNFSTPRAGKGSPTIPSSAALHTRSDNDRLSVVSRVSTEDGYEDIEVDDNKSDVSSLDERERWQLESDIQKKNSSALGMSLANLSHQGSSTKIAGGNTNYRDRDSEGPFVLSRY